MSSLMRSSMAEALRLTRGGDVAGATAHIMASLSGDRASGGAAGSARCESAPPLLSIPTSFLAPEARAPATHARPSGGRFETRSFQRGEARCAYWLYIPADAKPGMPLVVMLHGCTQSPDDFARGTRMNELADELGFLVAYPAQSRANNPQKCWNWFNPADQRRGGGEPALIAGLAGEVVDEQRADPGRVYIAGLSAGGAAAANLINAYPDVFAAAGIHSGLACGAAASVAEALMAMRGGKRARARSAPGAPFVPIITFHGDRDHIVSENNSGDIIAAASALAGVDLQHTTEQGRAAGGRSFTRDLSRNRAGEILIERWTVHGAGHAWSGGDPAGSYTDPQGPDASRAMLDFFLRHRLAAPRSGA